MKNAKRILALIVALATVMGMCAVMAGCDGNANGDAESTTAPVLGENTTYNITVKSAGGMALEGVAVSVYADSTLKDLQNYDETDANGEASVTLPASDSYAVTLSGVPKGYAVDASYSLTGANTEIVLTSSVIQGENLADTTLAVGDVMYDFTITDCNGEKITLSEVLQEKKMVLLNFWYTTCSWCVTEFPIMEEAYQMYKDDVEVIAVDPYGEPDATIVNFAATYGLTFPMGSCPTTWANTFGISGYPTSVIIDRYGMICVVESGAITSLRYFTSMFETMTTDDYEQKLYQYVEEMATTVKPTYEMDTSENIAAVLGVSELEVAFRPETDGDSAEYSWPFIETEKNGEKCLKASNQDIDESYAILYADVTLKAGEALGFDFLRSTELNADYLHVIVNDEAIYSISGYLEKETWETCYPIVAAQDGTYEVAICYIKDESTSVGEDTVYIKNMRIVNEADVDAETYLPRSAATSADGFEYEYVSIVFSNNDGYYHVGSENGPLLLVDLMNYTEFDEEKTIWEMTYNGDFTYNGVDYEEQLTQYCNYASNSNLLGICPVNQELYELLLVVDAVKGFDDEDNMEWMKACKYYQAYGTNGVQMEDPIKGLAIFSAYTATEGKDVPTNYFYYNRIIMPRGLLAKFVPSRTGVYRITSENESTDGVDGWIFDENREILLTYERDERMYQIENEVSMLYYMEAGKAYYIDIAFWDVYGEGYIYYDIEYVGKTYDAFKVCSPGYFTYDSDATGSAMYHTIAGGINVVLGDDGIYYHDLGNGKKGSPIYADFTSITMLNRPLSTTEEMAGWIDQGGFDFSKTEDDLQILHYLKQNDNDPEKTDEYLKEYWGDDYEAYYEIFQVEDVFNGIYHGNGEDLTEEIRKFESQIITSGKEELRGCVIVTEELAELLQKLMDKLTFAGVDYSWLKVCFYYDYMGR